MEMEFSADGTVLPESNLLLLAYPILKHKDVSTRTHSQV